MASSKEEGSWSTFRSKLYLWFSAPEIKVAQKARESQNSGFSPMRNVKAQLGLFIGNGSENNGKL